MLLHRPTEIRRETVTQEMRAILEPEDVYRVVQLMTPDSPEVVITADAPKKGLNAVYAYPRMPTGNVLSFTLAPGQQLWAASIENVAQLSVIIEYPVEV